MGYVNHSYNLYSPYQKIGNFFIGMSPLIAASIIIYFTATFLFSINMTSPFSPSHNYNYSQSTTAFKHPLTLITFFLQTTTAVLMGLWAFVLDNPIQGTILFYFLLSVAIHASPSKSDLRGAFSGGLSIISLTFLFNAVIQYFYSCCANGNISIWLADVKSGIIYTELVMMNLLCFTLALSLIGFILLFTLSLLSLTVKTAFSIINPRTNDTSHPL